MCDDVEVELLDPFIKFDSHGAREMDQQLGVLAALEEDWNLGPT